MAGMPIVCYLERTLIQQYVGLAMRMVLQVRILGRNLLWMSRRGRLIATLKVVLQLDLRMEISGPFQKRMLVLHQDGSGELKRIHQKQWMN